MTRVRPTAARRLSALLAALAILSLSATPALADSTMTSAGPLDEIIITDDLNCQVAHTSDEDYEFYPSGDTLGACGTFLAVGGTLYGPADVPAGSSAEDEPWTPVSQTGVTGSGTTGDPYKVITVVTAGATGLTITETDSYVVGQESYRTDVQITNGGNAAQSLILYRAGDCYLQNSDDGFGSVSGSAVACVAAVDPDAADPVPGDRIEQWFPLTSGSTYYQANYSEVWSWIGGQTAFPNTCECTQYQDNGAGLSWSLSVPAAGGVTVSHVTTFAPLGVDPLTAAKTADAGTSPAGGTNGYTITISNPNVSAITVSSIVDTLPTGFTYVPGSTTGATTADPAIVGSTLTWSGPFSAPAEGSIALSFDVIVSLVAGTYYNEAGGTAEGTTVTGTGPTAPIVVTAVAVEEPPALPAASINDVSVTEGNSGTVDAVFTVTLSAAASGTVTMAYATANGTATTPADYQAAAGTVSFAPGDTSETITVKVVGDTLDEPNETFFVNLSAPVGATLADAQGKGTILDDDPAQQVLADTNAAPARSPAAWVGFAMAVLLLTGVAFSALGFGRRAAAGRR